MFINHSAQGHKHITDFLFRHRRQGHSRSREQTAVAAVDMLLGASRNG